MFMTIDIPIWGQSSPEFFFGPVKCDGGRLPQLFLYLLWTRLLLQAKMAKKYYPQFLTLALSMII